MGDIHEAANIILNSSDNIDRVSAARDFLGIKSQLMYLERKIKRESPRITVSLRIETRDEKKFHLNALEAVKLMDMIEWMERR